MLDPRRICDHEIEDVGTPPVSNSYKNWKERQFGRQPDFVSSLGQLLQDKTSEFGSVHLQEDETANYPVPHLSNSMLETNENHSDFFKFGLQQEPVQSSSCNYCKAPNQRDPAIADLYRILWLQNEQLSLLHKQVADLVSLKEKTKTTVADMSTSTDDMPVTKSLKTSEASVNTVPICCQGCKPTTRKSKLHNKRPKKPPEDPLLSLKDLDVPRLDYSSSNASVHININEGDITSSSEVDESDTSSVEEPPNQVGWTFYNNVIGQVNNLLDLAKQPTHFPTPQDVDESCQLPPSYISKKVTFGSSSQKVQERIVRNESDISMKINSLASKYINCGINSQVRDISMCNVVTGNTNMSMATIRYMERHQLLQSPEPNPDLARRRNKHLYKVPPNVPSNKVLDVTAIRQQSKLLPKFN